MENENELQSVIEEFFEKTDYKVIDTILRGERGTTVLEIFVDNRDGIIFNDLVSISKDLNNVVDTKLSDSNLANLVVSSPGTDRPVKFIWQLYKHKDRILEIELMNAEILEGRLIGISEDGDGTIELEILHKEKNKKIISGMRVIEFKDIKNLKVKISFSKK
ncbi:MAG: hypothetical protein ABI462_00195 [Ignavibacteria bacterium]